MKNVKAMGLFAVILAVSGTAFGLFLDNSSGELQGVLNIGGQGVELMGGLFIVFALVFLYNGLR